MYELFVYKVVPKLGDKDACILKIFLLLLSYIYFNIELKIKETGHLKLNINTYINLPVKTIIN